MYSRLARPAVLDIRPYEPGKPLEEVRRELGLRDLVKLASNENPLGPSPLAVAAVRRAAGEIHRYPDPVCHRLTLALAERLGVEPSWIVCGNGADDLIRLAAEAFLDPGDEAVFADPSFITYRYAVQLMNARSVAVPLEGFTLDLERMAEAVSPRTKLIFVCNPNNPTGTAVGRAALERLLERLPEGVLVVLDEAYREYVADPDYPDGLDYVRRGHPVLVLRTFSKIHALAGLRIGYGVAAPELIEVLRRPRQPFPVNALAQEAALASLEDTAHLARGRENNDAGKEFLYRSLEERGIAYVPTQANFLLVRVDDSRAAFRSLLRRGVIVRPADAFGLSGFLRVTIGLPAENRRFVEALAEVG